MEDASVVNNRKHMPTGKRPEPSLIRGLGLWSAIAVIERVIEGKRLLFRTVGMLTKLVERFDSYRAREDEKPRDEDENDHEDE
jgi:hypothetical protein